MEDQAFFKEIQDYVFNLYQELNVGRFTINTTISALGLDPILTSSVQEAFDELVLTGALIIRVDIRCAGCGIPFWGKEGSEVSEEAKYYTKSSCWACDYSLNEDDVNEIRIAYILNRDLFP